MKISARNQFRGKIESILPGAVNTEVTLVLPDGQKVVSIITNSGANLLDLQVGKEAIALVKASSVLIMTDNSGIRLSARNCLSGTIGSLNLGPVHAEVTVTLPDGGEVSATITHRAVKALDLKEGTPATAVFKAPSVILAIPG